MQLRAKAIFQRNLIIISVILAGLFLRLYKIDQPILEYFPERQTQTAEITRNMYVNGWSDFWITKIRYEKTFLTPLVLELPVYNLIIAAAWKLFGPILVFGRLVSLVCYIIASIFFALILIKYTSRKILFPALVIFVFSPLHVLVSRSFQPDELAFMFLLISIYYRSYIFLMISGFIKLPFYIFGLIFTLERRGKALIIFKYFLFFIPISIWSIRASMIMSGQGYAGNYTISNWFDPLLFLDYRFYLSVFSIIHTNILTTLGLMLFTVGLFNCWRKKSMDIWKKWLFILILYVLFFNRHVSTHEYYSLPFLAPLAAFTGAGIAAIFGTVSLKSPFLKRLFVLTIFLFLTFGFITPYLSRINSFDFKNVNPVLIERYEKLF